METHIHARRATSMFHQVIVLFWAAEHRHIAVIWLWKSGVVKIKSDCHAWPEEGSHRWLFFPSSVSLHPPSPPPLTPVRCRWEWQQGNDSCQTADREGEGQSEEVPRDTDQGRRQTRSSCEWPKQLIKHCSARLATVREEITEASIQQQRSFHWHWP